MDYTVTKSHCQLCGCEFSGKGMGRHLSACVEKHAPKDANTLAKRYCYLSVRATYNRDYFLFLLVAQKATLEDLDDYLRATWLECCGHMSAFSYGKWGREVPMTTPIQRICERGEDLAYVYDFGSSTELQVKIFKEVKNAGEIKQDIILLARNGQPKFPCDECGDYPATTICAECQWEDSGWLCEKCAAGHGCDEEMFLPVVNSPRAGVCAYTGSDEDELFEDPPVLISREDEMILREMLGHAVEPEEALTYHEMCGFLFGLTITPGMVMPSEWLPVIFGEESLEFESKEQGQYYMNCLMKVYNELNGLFHEGDLQFPLSLVQVVKDAPAVREWAFGLEEALNLRPEYWLIDERPQTPTKDEEELAVCLAIIRAIVDPELGHELFDNDTDEQMDGLQLTLHERLLLMLPSAVTTLIVHGHNLEIERQRHFTRRVPGPPQPLRSEKVGRNDPCPCGSGKKYKKCCLNN